MTRTEAIKRLENGGLVTHPEIAFLPLEQKGNTLFYKHRGKRMKAGSVWDFFISRQNNVWDDLWEEVEEKREVAGYESLGGRRG